MGTDWFLYVVLVLLICLSAFFSATETAFSTVNKIRLRHYADNGNKKAKTALQIAEDYDKALSTILIGNNIVNLSSSSIATVLAVAMFGSSGAAISTIVITIVVLIFGEVLPKSYAKEHSESLALGVAKILKILMIVASPLVFVFVQLKKLMSRISRAESSPSMTEEELKYIIENSEEEGVLEEQESELVQSALEFDEKEVQDVLTPRVDMVAIDIEDDFATNRQIVLESRFSRIPVYRESSDNIIGILHTRDFLEAMLSGSEPSIDALMQPAYYIPKTQRASALLNEFKRSKLHIAVVVDAYGGTLGIVTVEDILEELVGEIWDEDEEERPKFKALSDSLFEVSGDMNIEDFFDEIDFDDRNFDCNSTTMGGWALETFRRIPTPGESFQYKNLLVTVRELDDQRVTKLHVELLPVEETEEED